MFSKSSDGRNFIQEIRKRRFEGSTDYQYDAQRARNENAVYDSETAEILSNAAPASNLPRQTRFERLFPTRYQKNEEEPCTLGPVSSNASNKVGSQTKQITLQQYFKPPQSLHEIEPPIINPPQLQHEREPFATKPPVQEVKPISGFRTAREELVIQNVKKYGHTGNSNTSHQSIDSNVNSRATGSGRSLGMRRNVHSGFVCPVRAEVAPEKPIEDSPPQDERLANIDPKMIEMIENEIMKKQEPVAWSDIAGLDYAKSVIEEIVIAALLRPDLYKGLRRPSRGILLFGPPGTGKTLIGRCIASQSKSTFFSISASSITSKYVGESEKMVRALFAVAAVHQPAVIFIDEIDSMLCKRSEGEQEFTRRLKNEFLVQLDGTATSEDDRIVVVGATNRPQELDEAARRRLVRRLYIPLPDLSARLQMINNLLTKVKHDLVPAAIDEVGKLTDGYSCADLKSLMHEAALKPLRGIPYNELLECTEESVRPVNKADIIASLRTVRPTVAKTDLLPYLEWNRLYGAVPESEN